MITRPEESYRLWRVVVCDQETSKEEAKSPLKGCEYKPTMGCDAERERERERRNLMGQLILQEKYKSYELPYSNDKVPRFRCPASHN